MVKNGKVIPMWKFVLVVVVKFLLGFLSVLVLVPGAMYVAVGVLKKKYYAKHS